MINICSYFTGKKSTNNLSGLLKNISKAKAIINVEYSSKKNKKKTLKFIYFKFFTFSQDLLPNVEHKLAALDELAQKL